LNRYGYGSEVCSTESDSGLLISVGSAVESLHQGNRLELSNYKMTFDENFDRLDVSAWGPGTRWIAIHHGTVISEMHSFQIRRVTVENGILRIEARRGRDGKWRSGLLASNDPRANGGFLVRNVELAHAGMPPSVLSGLLFPGAEGLREQPFEWPLHASMPLPCGGPEWTISY
jgi:hypothetical protein